MSLPPAKAREAVLIALFALNSHESSSDSLSPEGLLLSVMHQLKITKARAREALERAFLVFEKREELKERILQACVEYSWNRFGKIEQAVLLLGLFELQEGSIPTKVVLAESTRLGKKFASVTASRFINAALEAIKENKQIRTSETNDPLIDELKAAIEKGHTLEIESEIEEGKDSVS